MFTRHVSRQLAAQLDGQLAPSRAQQVEVHLQQCAHCRAEREQVQLGMTMVKSLPTVEAPAEIWSAIDAAFEEAEPRRATMVFAWRWVLASVVLLSVVGVGVAFWRLAHPLGDVVQLGVGRIRTGEWIETDARSQAALKIGEIGSVDVAPNTLVQVVAATQGEHRLALRRGEIRAKISAPPRLFFVDTASGTAVDLGCEYTLTSREDGSGTLQVIKGWVAFVWQGRESLVPAGASCQTRPKVGPGIPYFDDAPESLKQAVDSGPLDTILSASRVRDTLTLWHLLSRVERGDRARVFDRMVALTPLPAGVTREQALKLDPETLKRWKEELAWTW